MSSNSETSAPMGDPIGVSRKLGGDGAEAIQTIYLDSTALRALFGGLDKLM